jgi:outer membrane murein-binding lipoprotein Lpp
MSETPGIYKVGGDRPKIPQPSMQQLDSKLDRLSQRVDQLAARIDKLMLLLENQAAK